MPEEKKKMVDIDTSGSGAEVEVPEEKVTGNRTRSRGKG